MSPVQKVFLLTGLLAGVGILVSVVIIAVGGGFAGPGPSILNPPSTSDLWRVGENIKTGSSLKYILTSYGSRSSLINSRVSICFCESAGDFWKTSFIITNHSITKDANLLLSKKELTRKGEAAEAFRPYFDPLEISVLAIRDIARDPKYLVVGAQWDEILVNVSNVPIKVTGRESLKTKAGTFDSFVLSYTIGDKTSKIWISHNIPLPIKAEVYDSSGHLQYRYELESIVR